MQKYFSENWYHATDKFVNNARDFGSVNWCVLGNYKYDIPYATIGDGADKILIYSGLNGLDAFYGSAAQNMFLDKFAPRLSAEFRKKYTIILVHVVNGYGMDNRIIETVDADGNLVHLNRNFVIDYNKLPENTKYQYAHKMLLGKPGTKKINKLTEYRKQHLYDNTWYAIADGQYTHKNGLFYGGQIPTAENQMMMSICDKTIGNSKFAQVFGLYTGDGFYNDVYGNVSGTLQVLHSENHPAAQFYRHICWNMKNNVAARPHYTINGNFAHALEHRLVGATKKIFATDFFVGTKKTTDVPHINKFYHMGNARYELQKYGEISDKTKDILLNAFCPSSSMWRKAAMEETYRFYQDIINYMNAQCKSR